ncbi:MAG: C-GCAxxG-C-C family protein [Candidatus Cloacimonetes bacterium]|nr:C-GCAxxG-C-C family protein [Candidatus Cloacimonadota bacterium]
MDKIATRISACFREAGYNCAETTLQVLSEVFDQSLSTDVLYAAKGMNGAGRFRAQCGLVEGALMFLGIYCSLRNFDKTEIRNLCYDFAEQFTHRFGSISCSVLRPQGFRDDLPPFLCEDLANRSINFGIEFIKSKNI